MFVSLPLNTHSQPQEFKKVSRETNFTGQALFRPMFKRSLTKDTVSFTSKASFTAEPARDFVKEATQLSYAAKTSIHQGQISKGFQQLKQAYQIANDYLDKNLGYGVKGIENVYSTITAAIVDYYTHNHALYEAALPSPEFPSKGELSILLNNSIINQAKAIKSNAFQAKYFKKADTSPTEHLQQLTDLYKNTFELAELPGLDSQALANTRKTIEDIIVSQFDCDQFAPCRTPGDLAGKVIIILRKLEASKGNNIEPLLNLYCQFKSGTVDVIEKKPYYNPDNRPVEEIISELKNHLTFKQRQGLPPALQQLLAQVEDLSFLDGITEPPKGYFSTAIQNNAQADKIFRENAQKLIDSGIIDKNTAIVVDTGHTLPVIKQFELDENKAQLGQIAPVFKISHDEYMPSLSMSEHYDLQSIFRSYGVVHFLDDTKKAEIKGILNELKKYDHPASTYETISNYFFGQTDRIKEQAHLYYAGENATQNIPPHDNGALVIGLDIHRTRYINPSELPSPQALKELGYNKVVYLSEMPPKDLSKSNAEIQKATANAQFGYQISELIKNDIRDYLNQLKNFGIEVFSEGLDARNHSTNVSHDRYVEIDTRNNTYHWGIGEILKTFRR